MVVGAMSSLGIPGRALSCLLSRTFLQVLAMWDEGGTPGPEAPGGLCSSLLCFFPLTETSPEELLTIYEDVKNPQIRRNQVRHPRGWGFSQLVWKMPLGGWPSGAGDKENPTAVLRRILSLPIYLFSINLPALAKKEKRKTRELRRRQQAGGILVQSCPCWEGMKHSRGHGVVRRACCSCLPRWHPGSLPAGSAPRKGPTFLCVVSNHKFPHPCKPRLTFTGPLTVAQAGEGASLTSHNVRCSVLTVPWEEEASVWLRC